MNKIDVSLCIPTNGVVEWVFPVLDSIYEQNVDVNSYEIVITNNGNNIEFENKIQEYLKKYKNLKYKKTEAKGFLNQIECLKLAKGNLIKFINHRMKLRKGSLQYYIKIAQKYKNEQPVIYFSNGNIDMSGEECKCNNFDEFLEKLSYWSTWSAGIAIWKNQLDKIDFNNNINPLFPHTVFLFANKEASQYIINNKCLLNEIMDNFEKKEKYDYFYAFAIEFPNILLDLYKNDEISLKTFLKVKKKIKEYLSFSYYAYVYKKNSMPYIIDEVDKKIDVFFNSRAVKLYIPIAVFKKKKVSFKNRIKKYKECK